MKQRMVKIALSGLIACAVSFAEQTLTGRISGKLLDVGIEHKRRAWLPIALRLESGARGRG